ncbi:hypothetical protein H6F76_28200 [Leptolyngbya sp. FACHB-321]|uniref:hypothetical protein n=1 Tax=Leptolyngbya sp. FACHB-321 TaxID=2692807 RepID=UPI0016830283|nr:hypothetical protein [Leptolyngbya sp. FACHB-321]MBD2038838.1 hypothetical protein [Leptolyngbya sp. FACHB-321]
MLKTSLGDRDDPAMKWEMVYLNAPFHHHRFKILVAGVWAKASAAAWIAPLNLC